MSDQPARSRAFMFQDTDTIPAAPPREGARDVEVDVGEPAPEVSSAFFVEMDASTQYWDAYDVVPDTRYLDMFNVIGPTVFRAWTQLCIAEGTPGEPAAQAALDAQLHADQPAAALRGLDTLLTGLVQRHFGAADAADGPSADADAYLTVVEAFACDKLPPDPDRLSRVTALDPDDGRIPFAERHRMDGAGMWFTWAAVVDSASLLDGATGPAEPDRLRTLQLAGCAAGSAMDYVFRSTPGDPRAKTRPEYTNSPETLTLLRSSGRAWAQDHDEARRQVRDLFRIAASA